jgi:hypothetical protein
MKKLKPHQNHDARHERVILSAFGKNEPEPASERENKRTVEQQDRVWTSKTRKKAEQFTPQTRPAVFKLPENQLKKTP